MTMVNGDGDRDSHFKDGDCAFLKISRVEIVRNFVIFINDLFENL